YRELCKNDAALVCKSPNCEICNDYDHCFGDEIIPVRALAQTTLIPNETVWRTPC
ncbi:MAG: nitrogen fixation protein NifQ, partial [Alphaproteobacteria bacterium]|nr:nitrogen fixation protein NifQ [Alphaproteobacteria bacterium]